MGNIIHNEYDALGRLARSRQGSSSRLQRTYAYNVRSQLTSSASPLFTEKIYYESPRDNGATPCFNGDISSVSWSEKTAISKTSDMRNYDYLYDALDRLTGSRYSDYKNRTGFYDTDYIYDKQGNILDFIRTNVDPTDNTRTILVDDASFRYDGNQLMAYGDIGMETCSPDITLPNNYDAYGVLDGSVQFSYDACGNMTANTNKGIVKMTYNLLNQPASIYFRDGTVIRYDYSADGERLRARYGTVKYNVAIPEAGIMTADFQPSDTTGYNIKSTTVYDGRYTFYPYHPKTGMCVNLEIRIDGGIVKKFRNDYPTLLYEITDHQGNVRYVATASGAYKTEYQYYPFGGYFDNGMKYVHPYLYGGKEMEESNGLDEYDFEARNYDPALCRFNTMNPLSEKYYSISPYAYCADNPIRYLDPDGKRIKLSEGSTTILDALKSTLPKDYRDFVKLRNDGFLDETSLINGLSQMGNTQSVNYDVLCEIAASKKTVEISILTSPYAVNAEGSLSEDLAKFGPTEFFPADNLLPAAWVTQMGTSLSLAPKSHLWTDWDKEQRSKLTDKQLQFSPNSNYQIQLNKSMFLNKGSFLNGVQALSHELYGHIYFMFNGWDSCHGVNRNVDNPKLQNWLKQREDETNKNFAQ